ncbi:MAG: T9SS type A sorting domain-containing protein, partial [Bacteroidetes bacterium]|nr:T9SS type A sorting domain-containing protein [Bacteroidota bacterium]
CGQGEFTVLLNLVWGETPRHAFRLLHIDSTGQALWQTTHDLGSTEIFAEKLLSHNGEYIVLVNRLDNPAPMLWQLNAQGAYNTHSTFSQAHHTWGYGLTNTTSGFAIAGKEYNGSQYNASLLRMAANLSQISHSTHNNSSTGNAWYEDLTAHPTGFLAIGQCDNQGEGQQDVWICHIDSLGDTLKTETLGGEENDYGHAVVLVPQLFSAFIAGYNNSYSIAESGNAYLGGVKVDMGLPEVEEECKVPRALWVDGFVEIYPTGHPKEGEINTSLGILNKSSANDLINFSIQNEITNLVLYGVDHIFRDVNQNATGTAYKGYLSSFITKCDSLGILCTFLSGYKNKEYDRASFYNSELNVAGNNYKYSGKLRYIMPEHEFWNARKTTSSRHQSTNPTNDIVILSTGYTWDQHYYDCYTDHKNIMDSLNIIDASDANIWEVHDYIGYFYHRWDSSSNSYSETNTAWRAAIADTLEDMSNGIYIPYYLKHEWDSGVAFVGRNNANGYVQLWQERISYLGQNNSKPTRIFPLFSAEYFKSWSNNDYCGDDESTDFLGKYLHGPPANVGNSSNTFKKVEKLYLDQHDSIYTQTTAFPNLQNVEVNATSWYKYSCVQNKNFTDKGRNNCYVFTKHPLRIEDDKNHVLNTEISIYPNPNNGSFVIGSSIQKIESIRVFDYSGIMVFNRKLIEPIREVNFDLYPIQSGLYILVIECDNRTVSTRKLIVSK